MIDMISRNGLGRDIDQIQENIGNWAALLGLGYLSGSDVIVEWAVSLRLLQSSTDKVIEWPYSTRRLTRVQRLRSRSQPRKVATHSDDWSPDDSV